MKNACSIFLLISLFFLATSGCTPKISTDAATSLPLPSDTPLPPTEEPIPVPTVVPLQTLPIPTLASGQKITVFYDDDGSLDGTVALYYLLSHPQVDVIAIAITYGEAYPDVYIQHLGRQLDAFGIRDIPLGYGQSAPLAGGNDFPEWMREASNNFWGSPIPNPEKTYHTQPAPELYIELLNQASEPVNIFLTGPCTSLAQALRLDPGIRDHIAGVYIMGGAVYVPGNIPALLPDTSNTVAEWNIFADPLAAREVFESGLDIYLVPLDATNLVPISKEDTDQWRQGNQAAILSADSYDNRMDSLGVESLIIFDLITSVVMVHADLCGYQKLPLQVVTDNGATSGQTAVMDGQPANVNVCLEPDAEQIRQNLVDVFSNEVLLAASSPEPPVLSTPVSSEATVLTATPENLVFFDGFDSMLQSGWTWENENPDRWTLTPNGWLQIAGEDAGLLYGQAQSNLLWHDLPEGDFAITVRLQADPIANYQQAAIYIYEDPENYVAINSGYCTSCLPGGKGIFMEYKISGSWGAYSVPFEESDLYLKLESKENTISGYYASTPGDWQRLGRFGNYFTFKRVGIGVSNLDQERDDNADLVGLFDYFEITRP